MLAHGPGKASASAHAVKQTLWLSGRRAVPVINCEMERAWEGFQVHGTASDAIRPPVIASWHRSRAHDIPAARRQAPVISEGEFHRLRQHNGRLLRAARQAMNDARQLLAQTHSMLILADADGTILEAVGDARAVDTGQDVRLQRGGVWAEEKIGTNAIGTALAARKPVQIHAAEHFCAAVHRWTCAAAPICDPADGAVIGAVDISGSPSTFNPQNLAHAVAIAHQIEAVLERRMAMEHEQVLRHFLNRRALWQSDDIIAFGRSGTLIFSTDHAVREIRRRNEDFVAEGYLAPMRGAEPEEWARKVADMLPGTSLELVSEDGENIGGVIVLNSARRARPSVRTTRPVEERDYSFETIIGNSTIMRETRDKALRMAQSGLPVLLEGETGVGKELFARAFHAVSAPQGPFVPVNCGGLPRDLIASELFGYEKGAFTGADSAGRQGKVEAAANGLLCLDEIGEMPLELQSYLLRVLEDGVVYRVGSHVARRVALRLVSMTNRDLSEAVAQGQFRKDLFYRIAALRLRIPALRERGEDVLLLMEHYCIEAARRLGRDTPHVSAAAADALLAYSWPGNVRELRNVADMLVSMIRADSIGPDDLPAEIRAGHHGGASSKATDLRSVKNQIILDVIASCDGNLSRAARHLGIARSTLYMRLAAMSREGRGRGS